MYLSYDKMLKMEEVTVGLICSHGRHSITLRRHGPATLHNHSRYERSQEVLGVTKALGAKPSPCVQLLLAFGKDGPYGYTTWSDLPVSKYVRRVCKGFQEQMRYDSWRAAPRRKTPEYGSNPDKRARDWMAHYVTVASRRSQCCMRSSISIGASKHNLFRRAHLGKGLFLESWDDGKLTAANKDAYGPNSIVSEAVWQNIYESLRGDEAKAKYTAYRKYDLSDKNLPRCIYGNLSKLLAGLTGDALSSAMTDNASLLGR